MAGTIDNALDLYGNALRGTASQRAAFLSTAIDGMLWQDTDGIRMIWRKDGALWVPAVWRWRGTTAQMNSFGANAPDGFEWFSTTDNSDYVRLGGVWRGSPWMNVPTGQAGVTIGDYARHKISGGVYYLAFRSVSVSSGGTYSLLNTSSLFTPSKEIPITTLNGPDNGSAYMAWLTPAGLLRATMQASGSARGTLAIPIDM